MPHNCISASKEASYFPVLPLFSLYSHLQFLWIWLLSLLLSAEICIAARSEAKLPIRVNGTRFYIGNERFFLSGANTAWVRYGADFGNGQYAASRDTYLQLLADVSQAGGNSMRTWIHVDGRTSPQFDANGFVIGLDAKGTFLSDFKRYLDDARAQNILIFPTLWNGAFVSAEYKRLLQGLITNTTKQQSYVDNALIPWVRAVKAHPALGGWDIINEMEGIIITGEENAESCFDTRFLTGSTAGFAEELYHAEELLRFINWQVDAIRRVDPRALVTAGSWRQRSQTDQLDGRNLYKNECLLKAGARSWGTLTFYSTHVYAILDLAFWPDAAFKHNMSDYSVEKPLVLAEFSQVMGAGLTSGDQFSWAYTRGYSGAWSWQAVGTGAGSDSLVTQLKGIVVLKDKDDQTEGGRVHIDIRDREGAGNRFWGWLIGWIVRWLWG